MIVLFIDVRTLQFSKFEVGQGVEVEYGTPNTGRIRIDLNDANEDIILHFNMRYDRHNLVLNTHVGNWGPEEVFTTVDFTPGRLAKAKLVACGSGINIYFDGNFVTRYNYRYRHTASSIKSVKWVNLLERDKLESIKVLYAEYCN